VIDVFLMSALDIAVAPLSEIKLRQSLRCVSDVFLMSEFDIEVAPLSEIKLLLRLMCVSNVFLMSEFDIKIASLSPILANNKYSTVISFASILFIASTTLIVLSTVLFDAIVLL